MIFLKKDRAAGEDRQRLALNRHDIIKNVV
jgi:hypothetical protein